MKSFSLFLQEKDNKTSSQKGISDSEINKRLSASTTKGDQARSQYGTDGGYGDSNVGDEQQNKTNTKNNKTIVKDKTNTNKVSKKLSGSGKIVFKPKPGEKTASNLIIKQQTPGTNTTITPSKSGDVIKTRANRVTTNVTNTRDILKSIEKGSQRNISKPQVTTNVSSPKRFKSFLDRILVSTGVKPDPKYKSKFITPSSNVTGSNKVLSQVSKKALRSKIFKGLGRFAGGAFAVKDAVDKARDEKRLGRSRTSQILGGIAKGAGGYLGGALGATLGTLAGGGIGSFALGTGGAITGYNLGSRVGDYLYKKGRELATGETKLPGKKTFNKFKDDVSNKVKNLNLSNLGRNKSDKK